MLADEDKLRPEDYIREVRVGSQRRLLVEGPTDREFFRQLLFQLFPGHSSAVAIDTVQRIRGSVGADGHVLAGNRALVVRICDLAASSAEPEKLVGFVDREFDDFTFSPMLTDDQPGNKVAGRLVRARGHSMENYLFDFAAFADRMREYAPAEQIDDTLQLFERVFSDAVRVACTVGLTGYHHPVERRLEMLQTSVTWQMLRFSSDESRLELDLPSWVKELARRKIEVGWVAAAEQGYGQWWPMVREADYSVARWLCHGHIGFNVIWAAFVRCVHHACAQLPKDERDKIVREVQSDRQTNSDMRFRAVVNQWVRQALQERFDCPKVIFEMLGLS